MVSQNFTDKAISDLHTDRDPPVGNSAGDDGRGRLHTKISNKDSEPVPVKILIGSSGGLVTEKVALTISAGQANQWVDVPIPSINSVSTVETFDEFDVQRIILDWRISVNQTVQVRSPNALTLTVHIIGYVIT